ncbi:hypothetical protein CIP107507_01998 [Corynebacterium diphtheriae]|nr:hypothetical protein CIP107507_01998 [Corynebacterium diphtheriae]
MVGAWVWVWWWWGFRDHGFVITVSCWRMREHTNNPPRPEPHLGACSISSCPRIRDYVNPWSVPGCGCGGAGVFVITDSYWWFPDKREHTNNHTSATGSLHRVHKTHKYSQPSRLHRYVISDIHSMLRTPVSNNHFTRSEILRVDALGVVEPTSMTMAKYVQYLSNAKP